MSSDIRRTPKKTLDIQDAQNNIPLVFFLFEGGGGGGVKIFPFHKSATLRYPNLHIHN